MELESFKAILLRKADSNLQTLIQNMREDVLLESVVDALEKMAKPTHLTGTNANGPLTSFGANLDRTDMTQLRDALGHHLSHYKAALKGHHAAAEGSPEKAQMRQVADQHLEHALPLMHLAARAGAHSKGKLAIDYPPLAPWETNYTTLERNPNGRFKRDAKLLRARPSKGAKRDDEKSTGIPDYHYLEMAPHPHHEQVGKMPHSGGYPWEEIQIGSPEDIAAKKAFVHIEDVPGKKEYAPHEFDQHPIRGVADIQADHMTPEAMQEFANAHGSWRGGEHHKKWMEGQKAKFTADQEGYKKRGQAKSAPLYEGIPLHDKKTKKVFDAPPRTVAQPAASAAPAAAKASAPTAPVTAKPPTNIKPTKAAAKEHEMEAAYQAWKSLPKQHQQSILQAIPGLQDYVTKKGG